MTPRIPPRQRRHHRAMHGSRRVDLTPWAVRELGLDWANRLQDAVPAGVRLAITHSRGMWVGDLVVPGHHPIRLYSTSATGAAEQLLDQLSLALPGHAL